MHPYRQFNHPSPPLLQAPTRILWFFGLIDRRQRGRKAVSTTRPVREDGYEVPRILWFPSYQVQRNSVPPSVGLSSVRLSSVRLFPKLEAHQLLCQLPSSPLFYSAARTRSCLYSTAVNRWVWHGRAMNLWRTDARRRPSFSTLQQWNQFDDSTP